ncbi:sulfotransferase [Nocardioides sp.]|uniref:sulfotransferase n=1 Tax=Nocardioides sp. TaxID=35761 RepID=UPI001A18FBF8|nr:sulfotransferase [Nocardioides sp.]MBJ7356740.1 sulfotransferase [Nocardioides sp.]
MFERRGRERRDDLSYLFVVTYGRSGSTLLAGILNSIPGYLIRGENRDALHHLFLFHRTLADESARVGTNLGRQRTHPFYGIGDVPLDRSLTDIRTLVLDTVLRPKKDTRVTGFKEIRWYHPDLEEYVAWLRDVFPGARFLVNTRDHQSVLKSGWWAEGDHASGLAAAEAGILALAESLGEAAYRVHYDDYVADPAVLRGMFDWLGEPFDEAAVRAVMERKHSV